MANPAITMTREELEQLLEYSTSLPTGTTIGKKWRRNETEAMWYLYINRPEWYAQDYGTQPPPKKAKWIMGEYIPDPQGRPDYVGIKWTPIKLITIWRP